jgi:hypothetical protein
MTFHFFLLFLLSCLLLSLARPCRLSWGHHGPAQLRAAARRTPIRRLRDRRAPHTIAQPVASAVSTRQLWSLRLRLYAPDASVKSRRGAQKRGNTEDFACPNRKCPSSGITDAHIHAPLWGWHAWPGFAHPDVSRPCLPYHVSCSARHLLVPFETSLSPDCSGVGCASLWAGPFGSSAGLRLSANHSHEPFCRVRARTRRSCMGVASPTSRSTSCEPGCAAAHMCSGSGWPSTPPRAILPVLQLGPRTQHAAHMVIHSLRQLLAPGYLPLLTSDGFNVYFSALTAHVGQGLAGSRRGRQWQVAAGLIYGQVKKSSRRRKLARVTHVMRLGTQADLTVAKPRNGLLWAAEHLCWLLRLSALKRASHQ